MERKEHVPEGVARLAPDLLVVPAVIKHVHQSASECIRVYQSASERIRVYQTERSPLRQNILDGRDNARMHGLQRSTCTAGCDAGPRRETATRGGAARRTCRKRRAGMHGGREAYRQHPRAQHQRGERSRRGTAVGLGMPYAANRLCNSCINAHQDMTRHPGLVVTVIVMIIVIVIGGVKVALRWITVCLRLVKVDYGGLRWPVRLRPLHMQG